ncbi:MAG: hypothetical protein U1D55_05465 [Phycisphaerae bacterium]
MNRNMGFRLGVVAFGLALLCGTAQAQYDLSWFTIDGGGAMFTTGGSFTLSGTIGQPDAGVMSGGSFTLTGGFWAVPPSATPCPGDADGNRTVDSSDLGILLANWMTSVTPNTNGDFDGNGTVDSSDLGILLANWMVTCP